MHTFIHTRYIYTQYFCGQYTCSYWQFQYILYLCMLIVSIHSSLCDNENPTTHSISVGLDEQCWSQNQCHHHLNRPHLARLCVGPVHWCVSASCACCVSTPRCSTEALVITEHNFFANHARLSNKTCPFSSMTSYMKVFTQVCWDLFIFRSVKAPSGWSCCFSSCRSYFFARITSCHATNSLFMVLKAGPTILPSASFALEKSLHDLEKVLFSLIVMFHVAECFVHDEASTVHRYVKRIPPCHEQGMQLPTRGFRETVNRLTVELVQVQAQIAQDRRGSTFHAVADTQSLQRRLKYSWAHVQVLPEVGVRQDNQTHLPELMLCLWFLPFHPCLHLQVHKKVPVNAFCAQQEAPHDFLGSESSVRILEGLHGAHLWELGLAGNFAIDSQGLLVWHQSENNLPDCLIYVLEHRLTPDNVANSTWLIALAWIRIKTRMDVGGWRCTKFEVNGTNMEWVTLPAPPSVSSMTCYPKHKSKKASGNGDTIHPAKWTRGDRLRPRRHTLPRIIVLKS